MDPAGALAPAASRSQNAACSAMVRARCARRVVVARAEEDMLGSEAWYGGFWNRPAVTSIRWRWRAAWRVRCSTVAAHLCALAGAKLRAARQSLGGRPPRAKSPAARLLSRPMPIPASSEIAVAPSRARGGACFFLADGDRNRCPKRTRKTIIPGRRRCRNPWRTYFARYDARNRLVTGGALISTHDGAARLKPVVAARLQRLWPQIGAVKFDYVWNGYVGMTTDFLPRIHRIGPDAYAWTGCNGRAVALSIPLGAELARAVRGCPTPNWRCPSPSPRRWSPMDCCGVSRLCG